MSHLIKGVSSDHELLELANLINVKIDGIVDSSEVKKPLPRRGTYLILLRPPNVSIGHWCALYNGAYYDSMGEGPPEIFGNLPYNETQYQSAYGEFCGIWGLLWLYAKQKHHEELLRPFHDLNMKVL